MVSSAKKQKLRDDRNKIILRKSPRLNKFNVVIQGKLSNSGSRKEPSVEKYVKYHRLKIDADRKSLEKLHSKRGSSIHKASVNCFGPKYEKDFV